MNDKEKKFEPEIPEYEPIIDDALELQLEMPIFKNKIQETEKEELNQTEVPNLEIDLEAELEKKNLERSKLVNAILELIQKNTEKNLQKDLKNGFVAERICMEKYFNFYSCKEFFEKKVLEVQEMINSNDFKDDEMKTIFENSMKRRQNELFLEKIESNFGSLRIKTDDQMVDDGIKVTEYQGELGELVQDFKDGKFEVFNERVIENNLKKTLN